jgi:hypothetical protein
MGGARMTAPDDLARLIFDGIIERNKQLNEMHDGRDCQLRVPAAMELARHLASVVSRRDADLRTRIEDAFTAGWEARAVYRDPSVDLLVYERDLYARALVGDTREDAPTCTIPGCGHKWHAVAAADSRVPADTPSGQGQSAPRPQRRRPRPLGPGRTGRPHPRDRLMSVWLIAHVTLACSACRRDIHPGERVARTDAGDYVCEDCPA